MPRMMYFTLVRLPTEKAHGLQIMQNCEAFAEQGCDLSLWVPYRRNTAEMRAISDIHAYYGTTANFRIHRVPTPDLMPLAGGKAWLERIAFYLQIVIYILYLVIRLPFLRAEIYYTRDEWLALTLTFLKPRHTVAYEAHLLRTGGGASLQRLVARRCGTIIAITSHLREKLITERRAPAARTMVAHDGIRAARFAANRSILEARRDLGWPEDAFIIGFAGRLHMLNSDKGVDLLVEATRGLDDVWLALVGGPDDMADKLREQWQEIHGDDYRFIYVGHVLPAKVPEYLQAFDVCAMPHPATQQFAYYTSPLKLFEYMASGRAILASDLPAWADVIQNEQNALLFEAGNTHALSAAIIRLKANPELRKELGHQARIRAFEHYTWTVRAERILTFIREYKRMN